MSNTYTATRGESLAIGEVLKELFRATPLYMAIAALRRNVR